MTQITNKLLMPVEVAKTLRVNVLTVYSYIRRGDLKAIRLGRGYRIMPEDLALFIESKKVGSSFNHDHNQTEFHKLQKKEA
jgi:excisionase family DNA binding protein